MAEAIRLPARLAQAKIESGASWLEALLEEARQRFMAVRGWVLNPVPVEPVLAPTVLSEEAPSGPETCCLPGLMEFKIQREGNRIDLAMTLLSRDSLRVTLMKDGAETAKHLLSPERPSRSLKLEAGGDYALAITDLEGKVLYAPQEDGAAS